MRLSLEFAPRGAGLLPAQGDRDPWRVHLNHLRNVLMLAWAPVGHRSLKRLR